MVSKAKKVDFSFVQIVYGKEIAKRKTKLEISMTKKERNGVVSTGRSRSISKR